VRVETVTEDGPEQSLQNAIVTTLLTPNDPRSVDLFSDKEVALKGQPYLYNLVLDDRGQPIGTPDRAEAYARALVARAQRRSLQTAEGARTATFVDIPMVNDYEHQGAKRYKPYVDRYAEKYGVSRSLIYAIIRTESNFNPFAVSPVPAYGLMQLVPTSGGRDAYRKVTGNDAAPSKDYLFDPDRNVDLGTAYLSMVQQDYLGQVGDPVAREYCGIAAYNTGAGNVLKTFSRDRNEAFRLINSMQPGEVFDKLRNDLPYEETRQYLPKVVTARRSFSGY
jgi:membrane-bound lytic murein transglycosylase C